MIVKAIDEIFSEEILEVDEISTIDIRTEVLDEIVMRIQEDQGIDIADEAEADRGIGKDLIYL
jgi:hypothetical protein